MVINNFDEKMKWNVRKFYAFEIVATCLFFLPVIVLFWQENGLSMTQIMILQSIYALSTIILEIPSGYLADRYGRKTTLVISSILLVIGISLYSISHEFTNFILAEIVWGAGLAFLSGADSAFLYDTLKENNKEKYYKKIKGNANFYAFLAMSVGSIIGGFIAEISYRATFYFMIPFIALLIPITISMKEAKRKKLIYKKGYIHDIKEIFLKNIFYNKKVFFIILFSTVLLGINWAAWTLGQPYMQKTGIEIKYFGIIYAMFSGVAALSAKYSEEIEKKIGAKYSLFLIALLIPLAYFLLGSITLPLSFGFIFILQFVWGFSDTVTSDYINRETPSRIRATVLSISSMSMRIFYSLIGIVIGLIFDSKGAKETYFILFLLTLSLSIILLTILHKKKVF